MGVIESEDLGVASPLASNEDFALRRSQGIVLGVLGLLLTTLVVLLIRLVRFDHEHNILLVIVVLIILVSGSLVYSRLRVFRRIADRIEIESRKLEETDLALRRANVELQTRIDNDRREREEDQWVEATTRSIMLQFKSTLIPERIAEIVVESLGRALGADIVIGFAVGELHLSAFSKQWNVRPEAKFDESLLKKHGSDMSALADRLWRDRRVVVMNDSHLIDVSRGPITGFAAAARQRARSWVVAPMSHGSEVLGLLLIAMQEDVRIWSAAEIKLIQDVAFESAYAYLNLQVFNQMAEIVKGDAELGRLAELDKAKNDFIENMNHELRSPLTSIIGYVDLMIGDVDHDLEPDLAASLATVQRNAIRLQGLIANIMQISQTNFGNLPLDISTVDIGNLLGDACKSMSLDADDKGVELTVRLDSLPDKLLIDGDSNRLQQVFVNLLSNAIKYTPRGGSVTVIARRVGTENADDHCVEVTFTDSGIGIPSEEFPNIFTRFFRASTATQASIPGFGIGLSLVHSIVTEHHGTITFDSTVGKGTVFTVRLPTRFVSTALRDSSQPSL
ncbi:MAG: GAF domain-containing protein [Actinobacteria bacterium]|nr:MAG: GAF domain-containing protein [Actinomycetota bacterium]